MENQFVSFDIALELKELGFDEPCFATFEQHKNNKLTFCSPEIIELLGGYTKSVYNKGNYPCVLAPLYQQVLDWFREKHNIHIWIIPNSLNDYSYHYFKDGGYTFTKNGFISYKEALNEVIKEALKLIK